MGKILFKKVNDYQHTTVGYKCIHCEKVIVAFQDEDKNISEPSHRLNIMLQKQQINYCCKCGKRI